MHNAQKPGEILVQVSLRLFGLVAFYGIRITRPKNREIRKTVSADVTEVLRQVTISSGLQTRRSAPGVTEL